MNISFQGFRNVGAQKIEAYSNVGLKAQGKIINLELTNDITGKDLDNYRWILKRFPNPLNPNFINLYIRENVDLGTTEFSDSADYEPILKKFLSSLNPNFINQRTNDNTDLDTARFYINGHNDCASMEHLRVFSQLTDILKRVISTPETNFKVNKDYKESDDFYDSFAGGTRISDENIVNEMHKPKNVKVVANELIDDITNFVDDLLSPNIYE